MLYPLVNIVLPSDEHGEYSTLFTHTWNNKLYFDSWMNTFAAKKYDYYCKLGNIFLSLQAKGSYRLEIIGSKRPDGEPHHDDVLFSEEVNDDVCIPVPEANEYDGIYFSIIQNPAAPATIAGGAWCTDAAPLRQNKLAIVSCTFKREDFITRNVTLFEQFLRDTPNVQGRIKLVIIDNGQSLPGSLTSDCVELYPNMNTGGAGGFTRGLIEVMNKQAGFTHVLFMDDDVEMITESFYRTILIADYLKEEYKESFVGGAMLDIEQRNNQYEALAVHDGFFVRGLVPNLDISHYENVLHFNKFNPDMFRADAPFLSHGWWYCMFPISFAEKTGLPLPFFLRADDVEWSWRASARGIHFINMNGIFIWHAAFKWRVSKVTDYYYLQRNAFFMQVIHNPDFGSFYAQHFHHTKNYLLATYDYSALAIFTKALQDILRGSAVFRENPQIHCKILAELNTMLPWYDCHNEEELNTAEWRQTHTRKWRKRLYNWTHKGRFAPNFLRKKQAVALDWFPDPKIFRMTRSVKLYNLGTKKYSIRYYDRKRLHKCRKEIDALIKQITLHYDDICADYKKAYNEFRTQDFWKNYLNI